ncbi:MAG: hypothetical protein J0L96_07690 [Anaerolineae bacterium]|nr:hypothetical protein [Anaerolineae bacterium]
MKKIINLVLIFLFLAAIPIHPAHADVAPPETVPGSNINPESESTQVRMMAETVTLTISEDSADENDAVAETRAVFTMRNLGTVEETMNVRFPLSFFNGNSDGFGDFPEIDAIAVTVNGKSVSTRRESQPFLNSTSSFQERDELPWAVFEVTFPLDQDVIIEVVYNVQGFGYYPYEVFKYVLETGAGWNGTIGSAEVILRLPYEANSYNVWTQGVEGYGDATPGGVFSANEVRWRFEDLEPTFENNFQFVIVTPSLWQKVLTEDANVTKDRNDGEAWGRLAKAYKEIIRMPKGYLRSDIAGQGMFELSRSAYETCLGILPQDPLWLYGSAELLWAHYYYDLYFMGQPDTQNLLPTTLARLQTALKIDPNLQLAKDLLLQISYSLPSAVQQNEDGSFTLLGLTATPVPPTRIAEQATSTSTPAVTIPTPTYSMGVNTPEPVSAPTPLCGSAFLLPALFGMYIFTKHQR